MVTLSQSPLGHVSVHCPSSQSRYTHTNEPQRHTHVEQRAQLQLYFMYMHAFATNLPSVITSTLHLHTLNLRGLWYTYGICVPLNAQ